MHLGFRGCAISILFLAFIAQGNAADQIGDADEVIRIVNASFNGVSRELAVRDPVHLDEKIQTGEASSSILLLVDETRFIVGPSSDVILDSFVYDPVSNAGEMALSLTKGVLRFVTGNLPSESIRIITPTAELGIRGTSFTIFVDASDANVTHLSVEAGLVQFRSLTTGIEATLGQGQSIRSDATGGEVDAMAPAMAAATAGMTATVATTASPSKAVSTPRVSALAAVASATAAERSNVPASTGRANGTHY